MKKLSKIFPIIVIILCLVFALVACVPTGDETPKDDNEIVDEGGNDNSSNNGGGNGNLKPSPVGPLTPAKNVFVFEKIAGAEEYALKSVNIVNKEVVIPSLYNDKPVTAILAQAFYSNAVVEEVSIPDTITTIGARAFSLCVNLKKVSVSAYSELSEIGEKAFFACDRLEEIYLPQTLVKVGAEAFGGCVDLVALNFPNSLYEVGEGAFHCGWLDTITEDGVVYAGNVAYAFRYTATEPIAQDVTIKDGVTSIAGKAFYGEEWISSISIPSSVTSIGALALNNTQRLQNISVSEDNAVYSSLGNSLVEKATDTLLASSLNTIVAQGIKVVGEEAFAYSNLTEITLPESVTSIGKGAFKQSKIVSVNIPSEVTALEEEIFLNAEFLASITIGANLTSIKTSAFNYCLSLKEVIIENDSVLEDLDTAYACSGLTARAEVVYVLSSLEGQADRLIADFDEAPSDKAGYKKYVLEK